MKLPSFWQCLNHHFMHTSIGTPYCRTLNWIISFSFLANRFKCVSLCRHSNRTNITFNLSFCIKLNVIILLNVRFLRSACSVWVYSSSIKNKSKKEVKSHYFSNVNRYAYAWTVYMRRWFVTYDRDFLFIDAVMIFYGLFCVNKKNGVRHKQIYLYIFFEWIHRNRNFIFFKWKWEPKKKVKFRLENM